MKKVVSVKKSLTPSNYVEFVIATHAALLGLYILSPLYKIEQSTGPLAKVLANHAFIYALGAVLCTGGVSLLIGILSGRSKIRDVGLFICFVCLLFLTLSQVLAMTTFTMGWSYRAALTLITGVCYVFERIGERSRIDE